MSNNVLILYSEVMDYTFSSLIKFNEIYKINIYLICWDKKKLTPYVLKDRDGLIIKYKSEFENNNELIKYCLHINPIHIFISGWMDKDYLLVIKKFKKNKIKITSFLDNQWKGTIKQKIAVLISKFFIKNKFDYLWISGIYQFEYAKKLGYPNDKIYFGFYVANLDIFNRIFENRTKFILENKYPKNILFLGRLSKEKGIDILIEIFIKNQNKFPEWKLHIIGNGPQKEELIKISGNNSNIIFKEFIQPNELEEEIIKCGIFCLPSYFEPWGVVIHEMAAAGIPILASDCCGAATEFLVSNYNGYLFKKNDKADLSMKMKNLLNLDTEQLIAFGNRSHQLAQHLNSVRWSSTMYEIINRGKIQ